uniref:Peptidase S1 domain-containing protein n=1 Tax=Anopheles dirus TaxID=7168 RepID=A0A182NAA9_9DIPT
MGRVGSLVSCCAALLCCVSLLSASPAGASSLDGNATRAPSTFPVFFRSRFNPRSQQTNERLLSVPADVELLPPLVPTVRPPARATAPPVTEPAPAPADDGDAECGVINPAVDTFPWVAVLEHGGAPQPGAGRKRTLSKGVLIDRQHVLTTVSSVHNSHPTWVVTSVRLGDAPTRRHTSGRRPSQHGVQRFPIETVYLHESKDIALIRLGEGGVRNVTEYVRPICLPKEDHRLESFKLAAHVCQRAQEPRGAGRVSRSRLQPLDQVAGDDCNALLRPYGARLPVKSFCTRDVPADSCTGALGGPAVANIRGRYHVLGLRSYIQTESDVDAALDLPSIYVRVGGLRKWMAAVIKAEAFCCPPEPGTAE